MRHAQKNRSTRPKLDRRSDPRLSFLSLPAPGISCSADHGGVYARGGVDTVSPSHRYRVCVATAQKLFSLGQSMHPGSPGKTAAGPGALGVGSLSPQLLCLGLAAGTGACPMAPRLYHGWTQMVAP